MGGLVQAQAGINRGQLALREAAVGDTYHQVDMANRCRKPPGPLPIFLAGKRGQGFVVVRGLPGDSPNSWPENAIRGHLRPFGNFDTPTALAVY